MIRGSEFDHMIDLVWGDFDDFSNGGEEYVCWVIANDIKDIAAGNFEQEEAVKEFCDIIINARRMLALEYGVDADQMLIERLKEHDEKGPGEVMQRYVQRYDEIKAGEERNPVTRELGFTTLGDFGGPSDD